MIKPPVFSVASPRAFFPMKCFLESFFFFVLMVSLRSACLTSYPFCNSTMLMIGEYLNAFYFLRVLHLQVFLPPRTEGIWRPEFRSYILGISVELASYPGVHDSAGFLSAHNTTFLSEATDLLSLKGSLLSSDPGTVPERSTSWNSWRRPALLLPPPSHFKNMNLSWSQQNSEVFQH